jgi:hypothetical protein
MQKWEYARLVYERGTVLIRYSHRDEPTDSPNLMDVLRELGEAGWDMVAATARQGLETLLFKRPLTAE